MFNLLPEILKKEIKTNYFLRRWLVIFLAVLFLQLSFIIFLLPSWINSFFREKELVSQMVNFSKSAYKDADIAISIIESTNAKLKIINNNLGYMEMTPLINLLLPNKVPGIIINEMFFTSSTATSTTISLSGVSTSRESLITYTNILKGLKFFNKVDLPISNFAKNKDINFSMNILVSK